MLQNFDDYLELLNLSHEIGWQQVCEQESAKYETAHTTLGALLGQQWKLPKSMIETIYYQQDCDGIYQSGELDDTGLMLLTILKLGRQAVAIKNDWVAMQQEWELVRDDAAEFLKVEDSVMDDLLNSIVDKVSGE